MHQNSAQNLELVALLSRYLSPQDLVACVQVSSHWHQACIPRLWHTIDDTTLSWPNILWHGKPVSRAMTSHHGYKTKESEKNKDREWLDLVFRKYGQHIRDLTIHWSMFLEAASMASSSHSNGGEGGGLNLKSLKLDIWNVPHLRSGWPDTIYDSQPPPDDGDEALKQGWVLMQHCWNLISNNPGIERLDFGGRHPSPIGRESGPDQVFIERLSKVKHLKELKNLNIFEPSQIWELLAAAPTIESLSIFTSCWRIPDPLPEVNRTLRTLYVDCLDGVRDVRDILDLFPNLSHLAVPRGTSYFSYCSKAFCTWQGHFSRLSIQSIRSLDVNLNQDWDEVLCQLPNLAELTTDNRLNKPLSLALIKNCHKLKAIRLRKIPMCIAESKESRPVHDPANQLLVSMGYLRVLDSLVSFIHTDEMLRQPWACMGLEQLTCRIVGVDRLNESEQLTVDQVVASGYSGELSMEQVKAVEKFDRCQVQQHGVYDRLAKLTRLKHLDLGFENRDPRICAWDGYLIDGKFHLRYNGPTFDTLELSLASGLDRLGALKNLEMIGLECINHRIGRAEVVWMAKSWPNLNLVYGLDKEKVWAVEPDPTRAELKAYLQQLRPDVMHGTLYHGKS